MIPPKQRFQKTAAATPVAEAMVNPAMQTAFDAAMLQWLYSQQAAGSDAEAARNWFKVEGARGFAEVLQNIATPSKPVKPLPNRDNLEP